MDNNNTFKMKGKNIYFIDEQTQQPGNLGKSPFSMDFTVSSKNRSIKIIKDMGVNCYDNIKKLISKEDAEKMNYNPFFENKLKGNYIFI